MNYYKRHLGDFGKSLSNLSQGQVGAYDLLLDWHYANERPLPLDREELYNIGRCRTRAERDNVDRVLRYFDETPDGYVQKRALEEMERAARKGEHNRIVGRLGGRPKKDADGNPDANPEETQTVSKNNPSHKPLAISHKEQEQERAKAPLSAGQPANPCPHDEIIRLYHEILPANPRVKVWNGARADALRARWREDGKRQSLDYWARFLRHVADSPFLTGRAESRDGRPFLPGLDWMVKAANFAKIIEDRYHDGAKS